MDFEEQTKDIRDLKFIIYLSLCAYALYLNIHNLKYVCMFLFLYTYSFSMPTEFPLPDLLLSQQKKKKKVQIARICKL